MIATLALLAAALQGKGSPLFTLEHAKLSAADQVLAQTLQGLTAETGPRIWLVTGGIQDEILAGIRKEWPVHNAPDVWSLVERFKGEIKGALVYKLGTPSLNVATGLCGPMGAVAVEESQLPLARQRGLEVLLDTRGMTERQALERYRSRYRRGIIVEQVLDKPGHLRDFAVRHHAFVMDADSDFRKKVVAELGPNPLVFGWGRDEHRWIADISSAGGTGVPADWCLNLSVLESLRASKLAPPKRQPVSARPDKRYIAFVLSDGDNVQWLTGAFATDPRYYGSKRRGTFPMTWEVSPLLSRFAPRVLEAIFAKATPQDEFVTGPGLPGYTFPHLLPDRTATAAQSRRYLQDSGLRIVSILNDNAGALEDATPWLDLPEVEAVLYKDYAPYHRRSGAVLWHRTKPCVSYRFLLWENLMGIEDLLTNVKGMPTTGEGRFALINVHAWSFSSIGGPIQAVAKVIEALPENTEVVTAGQLIRMLKAQG